MSFDRNHRPHLIFRGAAQAILYTSPSGGGGGKTTYPQREFAAHGRRLQQELSRTREDLLSERAFKLATSQGLVKGGFVALDLSSEPGLVAESLEDAKSGATLALVKPESTERTTAVVSLPFADLDYLNRKLEAYLDDQSLTKTGKRANEPLINTIEHIRKPRLEDFWTDSEPFPSSNSSIAWEAWLEPRSDGRALEDELGFAGLGSASRPLSFVDREVYLVQATVAELRHALHRLDSLRELRSPSTVSEFMAMDRREQQDWIDNLPEPGSIPVDSPAVTILDTGVDADHPLLRSSFEESALVAYLPAWGTRDHHRHGHGTGMAGICRYGDSLDALLTSRGPDPFPYFLESGKILPPSGSNPQPLWGRITQSVVAQLEIANPRRRRVVSMAVTADRSADGSPSSWSAAMDQLASATGTTGLPHRLIVCSAGNVDVDHDYQYIDTNVNESPEDPSQAWNVITAGACTDLCQLPANLSVGWEPVGTRGDLSPSSRTGLMWSQQWPNKPDLCLEGGNFARSRSGDLICPPEMELLTTARTSTGMGLLTTTSQTSAATSLCACLAARIMFVYREVDLWPETVRALLVHSARWTPAMTLRYRGRSRGDRARQLLRTYGYGVPSLERALYSGFNALTLIAEGELQPFRRIGSEVKTNEMHLHDLPWPELSLERLGQTRVRMRVTLSYFIEPAPGTRRFTARHQYASHGLRFAVRTATETMEKFKQRINRLERHEESAKKFSSDAAKWLLGEERNRGSIHSDVWSGTAVDLAAKSAVAVYPVRGWWSEKPKLEQYEAKARYSLIISIETDAQTVTVQGQTVALDLYDEVVQKIAQPVQVASPS